jgi:hypothetical protein
MQETRMKKATILFGLLFDIEDEGKNIPPKRRVTSTKYTACIPEDRKLHNHRCDNLKSYHGNTSIFTSPPH